MATERDQYLARIPGALNALEAARKQTRKLQTRLDVAGVEHKGVVESIRADLDKFIGKYMDSAPAGMLDELVSLIGNRMFEAGATAAADGMEVAADVVDGMDGELQPEDVMVEEDMYNGKRKAASADGVYLLVKQMAESQAAIVVALETSYANVAKELKAQREQNTALAAELKAVKGYISLAPRQASKDAATLAAASDPLVTEAQKQRDNGDLGKVLPGLFR
jgi:hypothetical protein